MKKRYKIAENFLEIASEQDNDVWAKLQSDYEPFKDEPFKDESFKDENGAQAPTVAIRLIDGLIQIPDDCQLIFQDTPDDPDMLKLYVYRDANDSLYFKLIQPLDQQERVVLKMSPDYKNAEIYIEKKGDGPRPWQADASLTAAIQLAYYLATYDAGILFSHASCILKEGKTYLFLGKSGTGKSTHSRMWRAAFPDAILLNDDHPIIRIDRDGNATAYGSAWSGKTPCYKNLSAPIGGIVRIRRAPSNSIRLLSPLEAYASVLPSMFNAPFDRQLTDTRHQYLEKLITSTPCYELQCLPNVDAAHVCYQGVAKK